MAVARPAGHDGRMRDLRDGISMARNEMAFSVRPVFVGWITLLIQLPIQLFLTLWAAFFFGGMITSFHLFPKGSTAPFILFGAIAFFSVPAVAYLGKMLNYSRTQYCFYPDRLEFEEGFFSVNKKVIRLCDVREVTLHKGFLQRLYGLGTIYLATLATGTNTNYRPFAAFGFGNLSASGVSVRDVRDPDQVYQSIRQFIDAQRV
jgi:membrane protein YdbS with pleckstrin-like domain